MATVEMPEVAKEEDLESLAGGRLYEVVDGQITEKVEMGAYPTELGFVMGYFLADHVREHSLGKVVTEMLFRFDENNQRRPDAAFVSYDRWAKGKKTPDDDPWDVVPDLALAVISKNDKAWDVLDKVQLYFNSGVRSVWLVYPKQAVVRIYDSFGSNRVFLRTNILDGGEVLPGFRLHLDTFFEDDTEPAVEA